jgi:cellulose synthase/poly-beta-1,6-N-acetylglucosamine synthase-like glycosyltransferase
MNSIVNFLLGRPNYSSDSSNLSVTIVIPAWNEEDFIADTIKSILGQSYSNIKVIVVDDCSTDSTPEIVKQFENVVLMRTDINQGSKSKALNYAIPSIDTDIFICVDADTVLAPNAVENLLKAFNDENTYVASGYIFSKKQSNFWQSARYGEYLFGQEILKTGQQNANIVLVASGCFFGIRTSFLKQYMFNDRTMAEDMDLTWIAIEHKKRITFVEDAICYVDDPYNYTTYTNQVSRWYRGFFQNLKVRRFNLFEHNIKLGLVAYAYMIVNVISLPLTIFAILFVPASITIYVLFWLLLCLVLMMYKGYEQNESILTYPKHFVYSIAIFPIVYYIYIKSFIQEIILNKQLKTWVKGH